MDKRNCFTLIGLGLLSCVVARTTTSSSTTSTSRTTVNPYRIPSQTFTTVVATDQRDYYNGPRVIEQFNHRNPDGSYEFRYELSDGNTRYERGYFVNRNSLPTLVVTGYYAYRLDDGRYTTTFYTADENGYRQQTSTSSQGWTNLPRTIDIPTEADESDGNLLGILSSTGVQRTYTENLKNLQENGSNDI